MRWLGLAGGDRGGEPSLSGMAQTSGAGRGSARHGLAMIPGDLNGRRSLIQPCRSRHKFDDNDPAACPAERLDAIKPDREALAGRQPVGDSNASSFARLGAMARWMAAGREADPAGDGRADPPPKKIKNGGLPRTARMWMEAGMPGSPLVGRRAGRPPDPPFGDRLKAGFRSICRGPCEAGGLGATAAFLCMPEMDEAAPCAKGRTPAVLAIAARLFEKCEVHER